MNIKPQYPGLIWCPVDIPKIDFALEVVSSFKKEYIPDTAGSFESFRLTTKSVNYSASEWRDDLDEPMRKLSTYIETYLPFKHLINIKIHHPWKKGNPHIDFVRPKDNIELFEHNRSMEPCGYRIVLQGARFGDMEVYSSGKVITPVLPDTTDCYVLGHTNVVHSITHACPDRYIVFCHGIMDVEMHRDLIDRSLRKYSDFAVWDDKLIKDME